MAMSVIKMKSTLEAVDSSFDWGQRESWIIICPNPNVADALRAKVSVLSTDSDIATTTIAKFLSDLYKKNFPERVVSRKADLMPILATLWKLKMEDTDPSVFHQAFELFTDLRSFTLDKGLMGEILEHYPEAIRDAVTTFWLVVENEEIIDEHQAYSDLNQALLEPDSSTTVADGLIFTGFSHLSANQIEVLKTLGKFTDVFLPIPEKVIEGALSTDWVDWILSQAGAIEESNNKEEKKNFNLSFFSKGRGNYVLASALEKESGDVIIPKKRAGFPNILEIPSRSFFFKSDVDLFSGISKELKISLLKTIKSSPERSLASDEIKTSLLSQIGGATPSKQEDFIKIKYVTLFLNALKHYESLSESNEVINEFDLSIIFDIVKLNQPRNFNIPLKKDFSFSLLSLADLYQVDISKKNYLYVCADHDLAVGGVPDYPKEVQELLVSLGPMRRQALDLSFFISHIGDLLDSGSLEFLIEEGLDIHDQVWSGLLEEKEFNKIEYSPKENKDFSESLENTSLIRSHHVEKLSASRMQTYRECPRKYYFTYIDKLDLEPPRSETIDPRHLGEAQHAVVQRYLAESAELDNDRIHQLVVEELSRHLLPAILKTPKLYQESYAETFFYSQNTIEQLLKIKGLDPDAQFSFEVPIENQRALGRADVMIESKKLGKMIFDLKRSGGSIPDKYKFQGMKSIQLWFYLFFLAQKQELTAFGYINLSDAGDSLLFTVDKDIEEALIALGFLRLKKAEKLKEELEFYLDQFKELFEEIYEAINHSESMEINPIDASVCTFCSGRLVCDRGVLE